MSNNIPHIFPDRRRAAFACGGFVINRLGEAVAARGKASMAVSGGTTPKLLFEYMSGVSFPWEQVQFFFVDERGVPPTDIDSNYRLARENFLTPANFPPQNVVRIEGELSFQEAAARYSHAIRERFGLKDGAMPVFDVIQHGMGPDGHTASLFPGAPEINDRAGIAAPVIATKLPPQRVTLLPGVLLASRSTVFLVDGVDKQEALNEVIGGAEDPMKWPSQLLARGGKQVDWFLANLQWPDGSATADSAAKQQSNTTGSPC